MNGLLLHSGLGDGLPERVTFEIRMEDVKMSFDRRETGEVGAHLWKSGPSGHSDSTDCGS